MGSKFNIDCKVDRTPIRLRLSGTLDGSTASELANLIDGLRLEKDELLIDIQKPVKVFHFGRAVLRRCLAAGAFPLDRLVFSGKLAGDIDPRNCLVLQTTNLCRKTHHDYPGEPNKPTLSRSEKNKLQ